MAYRIFNPEDDNWEIREIDIQAVTFYGPDEHPWISNLKVYAERLHKDVYHNIVLPCFERYEGGYFSGCDICLEMFKRRKEYQNLLKEKTIFETPHNVERNPEFPDS